MKVVDKIKAFRESLNTENIQAFIVPSTDPHIGEYIPEHWESRKWLSGFTGSAGTLVITLNDAALWTDSRYFLQAEEQLQGSDIQLMKMGLANTPDIKDWIKTQLNVGETVAFDGSVYSASDATALIGFFNEEGIDVRTDFDPFYIWNNRPAIPENKAFIIPKSFTGESTKSKIARVLSELKKVNCNTTLLASLDTIAWLCNLRGNDINYNPVAVSYAIVSEKETVLFINPKKLTTEVVDYLNNEGVIIAEYEKVFSYVKKLSKHNKVLLTPNKINYHLYSSIPSECNIVKCDVNPVDYLKAIKNQTEIDGFKNAMIKDGVALTKFFIWLEKQLASGNKVTELDVSDKLKEFRSEQKLFFCESFTTIAGYAEHGAIVHYSASTESNATILPKGILLIDSGAQYFDGTTDITRTIAVGDVTDEMKKDFTNVLKGNIQLSKAIFPKGTVGMQLDILARQFIWEESQNFLHGTGHGIGHFLNVHEGPQSIRMNFNPVAMEPGMVTSNEPGLYKTGKYGIRIENLILTIPHKTTEFGEFYAFETLTLCPIDRKLINWTLLTEEEMQWLNNYHNMVYDKLSPFLSDEEKVWLEKSINQ
ncbi:Xaa-Pro aminopeptidase [Dysgonomonadaceae bacterium PH5-43]|nr:Xaa-Pro aminopeptidase [Dysgonomonadaceae bacterium PH5-43]